MQLKIVIPVATTATAVAVAWAYHVYVRSCRVPIFADGLLGLIGKTPLIELRILSAETGCHILAKAEHLNPGGSIKDRVAKWMILEAEKCEAIQPGDTIVEARCGNTGIGLALISAARGYNCVFSMPEDISTEKIELMKTLGAQVRLCPSATPFDAVDPCVRDAERVAASSNGFFMQQSDNLANYRCHEATTGPEIWEQTAGQVDAFVCGFSTGGTMAGVSSFLKRKSPETLAYAICPPGCGVKGFLERGVFESAGSSCIEGVGLKRSTANSKQAKLDGALSVSDAEALKMCHYLVRYVQRMMLCND